MPKIGIDQIQDETYDFSWRTDVSHCITGVLGVDYRRWRWSVLLLRVADRVSFFIRCDSSFTDVLLFAIG